MSKTSKNYRLQIERKMNFERDPQAGRNGDFERKVKRGWFIGSPDFKQKLNTFLEGRTHNDNYRGSQRREHDVWEAERLLELALKELKLTEETVLAARSVWLEKQAIAWLLKSNTAVTGKWLAERLQMGHPVNTSRAINRFRKEESREVKKMKKRMIKCVG